MAAILVCAWAAAAARAEDPSRSSAAFARLPLGARAPALGGGTAAIDAEATAAVANPAGLATLDPAAMGLFHTGFLPGGESELHAAVAGWVTPELVVGVAIFSRNLGEVEFRQANTLTPGSVEQASAQVYTGALGARLFPALDVGASFRYLQESVGYLFASGFSADGGLLYRPWPRVSAALVARDLPGTSFGWHTTGSAVAGGSDNLDRSLVLGAAVDLNPVLVVLQADSPSDDARHVSGGVEWDIHPAFTFRAGLRDGLFATGFGARAVVGKWYGVRLDYAFARSPVGGVAFEHRFALTLAWLDWRVKRDRLLFPTEEEVARPDSPGWLRPSRRPVPLFTWPDL
ncbi:MAG: hypothetical protein AAB152_12360 [Candidatus Coatesbacteria bacterium]